MSRGSIFSIKKESIFQLEFSDWTSNAD